MRRIRLPLLISTLGMVAVSGCSTSTESVIPKFPGPAPVASSPTSAVRLFEWAVEHEDLDVIGGLLADDFVYARAAVDSAGNPATDVHDRAWFLAALMAVFDAGSVSITLDQNLVPFPDSRVGRNPNWHRQIRSSIELRVRDASTNTSFDVTGSARFFVTRGDSVAIPPELITRGVMPDPTRWWIDRLEDETLVGSGAPRAASPASTFTLATLLEYCLTRSPR